MNKKQKIALSVLLLATIIITASATILFQHDITNTVSVKVDSKLNVQWNGSGLECTTIDWGEMGSTETRDMEIHFSDYLHVSNRGNTQVYVAWQATNLPSRFEITAIYGFYGDSPIAWKEPIPQNDFSKINLDPNIWVCFNFILTTTNAVGGASTFTISLLTADSPTG